MAVRASPGLRGFRRRLAQVLRAFAEERGSRVSAVSALKLTRQTFYNYIGSKRIPESTNIPGVPELRRVAQVTRVSLDWLFFARPGEPVRYRGETRDVAELGRDLSLELTRRVVNATPLSPDFVEDFLRRRGIDDVVDEMAAILCRQVLEDADRVRAAQAQRTSDIFESLRVSRMDPTERMRHIVEKFSALAPSSADEAAYRELLTRPSPDRETKRVSTKSMPAKRR